MKGWLRIIIVMRSNLLMLARKRRTGSSPSQVRVRITPFIAPLEARILLSKCSTPKACASTIEIGALWTLHIRSSHHNRETESSRQKSSKDTKPLRVKCALHEVLALERSCRRPSTGETTIRTMILYRHTLSYARCQEKWSLSHRDQLVGWRLQPP